ncbi:MAG TPA: FtsQ-type POTRA domain-containing protein [Longimicrobiales bacterium]|nr:FtsQ-type POTRA domain-containing protein [Longimicrobiales bacterium]
MPRIAFRVALLLALGWTLSLAGERAPEALAKVPVFRARKHEFHGLRFLTSQTVLRTAGIGPDASLWDDPHAWEERLERHPLVQDAQVRRRFPSTLVVTVEERSPVGLVPTPTLEPVDAEGRFLPLDPSRFPLDYPILRPGHIQGGGDAEMSQLKIRELAAAAALMRTEAEFWSQVSEVEAGDNGGLVVHRGQPEVIFRLPPKVEPHRLREAMAVLDDAMSRGGGRTPESVDLRFADYVFLDWGRGGRP